MSKGLPWVGRGKPAPVARDQYPRAPGAYAPPGADEAANRTEDIPGSLSPGPTGHSNQTTGRASSYGPKQETSSQTHESLAKDWPQSRRKPRLMS